MSMKKFLSLVAAVLFAAGMMAEPVVLPATLDVTNVSFRSEGMPDFVIEEGQDYAGTYFDMGAHDSSNDTLLYAEWDVTIQPLKYDLAVDVYNTNSWRVQIYILNQAGDTLKSLRYKGSSGQKGNFAIGSIDMRDLAAGNYKLRAHAATAWSAMKLKDIIVKADYQGANVDLPGTLLPDYALLSANASIKNNAIAFKPSTAPDEYATWNVSFASAGSFNVAIDITASNGHNYGVALLSADGQTEIGAVNEGGQNSSTGAKELGAIAVPAAGNYIVKLTNSIQWSEAVLNSITFAAPAQPKTIYFKAEQSWWNYDYENRTAPGAYAWADGVPANAEWPGVRMEKVEGEEYVWKIELDAKYTNVIFTRCTGTGDIEFKGVKTVDLTIPTDDKDMYTMTLAEIDWSNIPADGVAQGEWSKYAPYVPTLEDGFYLIGTINGVASTWNAAALKAEHKFVPNNNVEFKLDVTLAAGDEIQVVNVLSDKITAWFPGGEGNNYVVDANHAGQKTVYFRPDKGGDAAWHLGCIYIDANAAEPVAVAKNFEIDMQTEVFGGAMAQYLYIDAENAYNYSADAPAEYNAYFEAQGFTAGHGYHQLIVTVPVEAGNYRVMLGKCQYAYSADYTMAYVKTLDNQVLGSGKQNTTSAEEGGVCYHQDTEHNKVRIDFVSAEAQMVKIYCAHYTPYIKFEKINDTTGLQNTAVDGKVVKTIENGQLIIIKNGVRYNAVGAQL